MSVADERTLPRGWIATSLGEVIEPRSGKADPQATPAALFIGMEQIEAETMRLLGTVPAGSMKSGANTFEPGDVLYGRLRPYLNKVYQPDFAGLCSGELIPFPPTPAILGKFLKYRLNAMDFVRFANQLNTGDRPRVDFDQMKPFAVLLPPYSEQERISDAIEELTSDLDAGVEALKRVQVKLGHYRAAVLKAAVEGALTADWREQHPDTEPASELLKRILTERRRRWEETQTAKFKAADKQPPKGWQSKYKEPAAPDTTNLPTLPPGWCWASPAQLAAPEDYALAIGPFGSNLKVEDYKPAGVPLIFVRNIRSVRFSNRGDPCISPDKAKELRAHRVEGGDILITKMGDPPGDACIYPRHLPPAVLTADCIKLTPSPLLPRAELFVHVIHSNQTKAQLAQITKGVAQLKVSLGRFEGVAFPLAPIGESETLADQIEDLFSVLEHLEGDVEARLITSQALRQSILRHAFTGQLVPQNPKDEPASELLKRIAAEREARAKGETKKPRSRAKAATKA